MNLEDDEAGRLAAFRARFGRGYDVNMPAQEGEGKEADRAKEQKEAEEEDDNMLDLISSFGQSEEPVGPKKRKWVAGQGYVVDE
jgi:hypothetical protein